MYSLPHIIGVMTTLLQAHKVPYGDTFFFTRGVYRTAHACWLRTRGCFRASRAGNTDTHTRFL